MFNYQRVMKIIRDLESVVIHRGCQSQQFLPSQQPFWINQNVLKMNRTQCYRNKIRGVFNRFQRRFTYNHLDMSHWNNGWQRSKTSHEDYGSACLEYHFCFDNDDNLPILWSAHNNQSANSWKSQRCLQRQQLAKHREQDLGSRHFFSENQNSCGSCSSALNHPFLGHPFATVTHP